MGRLKNIMKIGIKKNSRGNPRFASKKQAMRAMKYDLLHTRPEKYVLEPNKKGEHLFLKNPYRYDLRGYDTAPVTGGRRKSTSPKRKSTSPKRKSASPKR